MIDDDARYVEAKRLLEQTGCFITVFRTDVPGVIIPTHLRQNKTVVLSWGRYLQPPVDDLYISWVGLEGTLMFGERQYKCFVPWNAVTSVRPMGVHGVKPSLVSYIGGGKKMSPPRAGHLRRVV